MTRPLIILIVLIATAGCGSKIPDGVHYEILKEVPVTNMMYRKTSIYVRINKEISEVILTEIAKELYKERKDKYGFLFIYYYLPNVNINEMGAGAWASSNYTFNHDYPYIEIYGTKRKELDVEFMKENNLGEYSKEDNERQKIYLTGTVLFSNGDTATDYLLYATENNDTLKSTINKNPKFEIILDLGKKYVFGIKKEGFISKHIIVDVINCGDYEDQKYGFEFPMEIKLIKGNSSEPSLEVATIGYDPSTGYIENLKSR